MNPKTTLLLCVFIVPTDDNQQFFGGFEQLLKSNPEACNQVSFTHFLIDPQVAIPLLSRAQNYLAHHKLGFALFPLSSPVISFGLPPETTKWLENRGFEVWNATAQTK
jgi:hypothetical protein